MSVKTPIVLIMAALVAAASGRSEAQQPRPVPVSAVRYEVTFDTATAQTRTILVAMKFNASKSGDVLLSLPEWTPGAYEVGNYARFIGDFSVRSGTDSLDWDKYDPDTWRVHASHSGEIAVSFQYKADSLDNAMSWSKPDFAFFNGTNLFMYPEGQGTDFAATVTVITTPGWRITTGMKPGASVNTFTAPSYHYLVDMPFFVVCF